MSLDEKIVRVSGLNVYYGKDGLVTHIKPAYSLKPVSWTVWEGYRPIYPDETNFVLEYDVTYINQLLLLLTYAEDKAQETKEEVRRHGSLGDR